MILSPIKTIAFIISLCTFVFGLSQNKSSTEAITTSNNSIQTSKKLDAHLPPSANFDLSNWKLALPIDEDKNGKSDNIYEAELNAGYVNKNYFFTSKDGGMVFKCPVKGATTKNSTYARVELREMLRGKNKAHKVKGVNKNNWVFSSATKKDRNAAAAVDGEMTATLAVNHVTTTGEKKHIGRLVIGQIHANTDEPIKIFYRKLKDNELGSVYFSHEVNQGDSTFYNFVGEKSNSAPNPKDGIALNEKFSYKIKVIGNKMWVTLSRKGKKDIVKSVDMKKSGYDKSGQYHYFKAGIYHLNKTGDADDYAQVTFYELKQSH